MQSPVFPENVQNRACQAAFDGDINTLHSLVNEYGIGVLKSVGFVKGADAAVSGNSGTANFVPDLEKNPFQTGPLLGLYTDPAKARELGGFHGQNAHHLEFSLQAVGETDARFPRSSVLQYAVFAGKIDVVRFLVRGQCVPVDFCGPFRWTPLQIAAGRWRDIDESKMQILEDILVQRG